MDERDAPSAGPAPGRFIDQVIARRPAALQRGVEIGDAVGDVMDARTALRKELRHGTGGIAGLEQLDVDTAEIQADDRGAVEGFGPSGRESQDLAIEAKRLCEARDRDTDVSNRRVHRKSN